MPLGMGNPQDKSNLTSALINCVLFSPFYAIHVSNLIDKIFARVQIFNMMFANSIK